MQNETARYCGPQVPTNFCEYSFQGALDESWSCSSGESAEIECKEALGYAACASLVLVDLHCSNPVLVGILSYC
jgi:hypothetical protein